MYNHLNKTIFQHRSKTNDHTDMCLYSKKHATHLFGGTKKNKLNVTQLQLSLHTLLILSGSQITLT